MMKNLIFIFAGNNVTHAFDKVFSGESSFSRCLSWAQSVPERAGIIVMTSDALCDQVQMEINEKTTDIKIVKKDSWNCREIIETMATEVSSCKADRAVYSTADRPFMDGKLTRELLECHEKYISEYTFADGYPLGFAPEVIDCGTLNILSTFARETHAEFGDAGVTPDCIFNLMKTEINSFEIEAVIAPKDYRMLRFDFSCGKKRNLVACQKLYQTACEAGVELEAVKLSDLAEKTAQVHQTLPAFFNVQISSRMNSVPIYSAFSNPQKDNMSLEKFNGLVSQIADFSEDAVIGLSAFGEPLLEENISSYVESVLKNRNLSVLIETDGTLVTEELADKIAAVSSACGKRNNGENNIIWIVSIDAASDEMYSKIISNGNFKKAVASISILENKFPGAVYPQFTRMNENEDDLEQFYRFWNDKNSPSKGKLIIQKYDDCCKSLPPRKPADLSPLERNVCWHLKRDMTILSDGTVPLCKQFAFSSSIGNVFEEGIEKIWSKTLDVVEKHIAGEYGEKCRDCDEYYTFNF